MHVAHLTIAVGVIRVEEEILDGAGVGVWGLIGRDADSVGGSNGRATGNVDIASIGSDLSPSTWNSMESTKGTLTVA